MRIVSEPVDVTGRVIPLRHTLRCILEIPGFLTEMKKYVKELTNNSTKLSNFIQGDMWKTKLQKFGNKTVFPLFIYFDDYETGNPLGSHAGSQKLGAVYTSIPCIPPQYASNLSSIYLTLLFYAQDRKSFGNAAVFNVLIN